MFGPLVAAVMVLVSAGCDHASAPLPAPPAPPPLPPPAEQLVTDLGDLGADEVEARAIDDSGRVVGSLYWRSPYTVSAFLWENGVMRILPGLGSSDRTVASAFGPGGMVAGASGLTVVTWDAAGGLRPAGPPLEQGPDHIEARAVGPDGSILAEVLGEHYEAALLYRDGQVRRAAASWFYSSSVRPAAMNTRGQVVGSAFYDEAPMAIPLYRPFLWEDSVVRDLGTMGTFVCDEDDPTKGRCSDGRAWDINDRGDIVGSTTGRGGGMTPFLWRSGVMQELLPGSGYQGEARFIDESGRITGVWYQHPSGVQTAFVWENGVFRDLPSLDGESTVWGVNESGVIVGSSTTAAGDMRAVVWRNGIISELPFGPQGGRTSIATGVNARGDVIGWSSAAGLNARPERGLLWPTPSGVSHP